MSKEVIVFIEGPAPTAEERELYEAVGGTQFLYAALCGDIVVKHQWATAIDESIIPEGYNTTKPEPQKAEQVPSTNPTAPVQALPAGGLGIPAAGSTDRAPVATSGLPVPSFVIPKE